ncbi:maltose acetyltransferase domain-containing protein [Liquorilactobacillus cacaonum]|uniref:Acetyltransferase n=1 Tax=Liquorilactobacillus cacaonum DSM 21116 TaxID=1423729 RepID=A0A0R2CM52_9LACO|nr:maltose acetyltransferase domain-containing protein [Liquorilactobacillus cacaonum]KRM92664.1 acetyltransferase [Liquorilactobacillus cacaonum DSM 21116]
MNLYEHDKLTENEIRHVKGITNSGELYYDYDPLISRARNYAYSECRRYDNEYRSGKVRIEILDALFNHLGVNAAFSIGFICEFGFNLTIGDNFSAGRDFKVIDCNEVKIGNSVSIGAQVGIYTSNHAENPKLRADHWCYEQPIIIGDNVIIEDNVVITPGVVICEGALIKSGSVVTHDIPINAIAKGNPCSWVF